MGKIIIGADGGGTNTTLAAADDMGHILGYCGCGSINYNNTDIRQCRANLKTGINKLLESLRLDDYDCLSIGLCALSGAATDEEKIFFCETVFDPDKTILHSDAYMALIGAAPMCPGVMVVSGTGTMCVARDGNDNTLSSGGWGYLLGDEGSCYYIAWRGIISAVHHFEGRGESTAITGKLMEYCGIRDMRALINWLYEPKVEIARIANFAKAVIQCARDDDLTAKKIVTDAICVLADTASRLIETLQLTEGIIGIYGGLFEHNPDITDRFRKIMGRLHPGFTVDYPEFAPELGAVIYYFIQTGELNEDILNNIRASKKKEAICFEGV